MRLLTPAIFVLAVAACSATSNKFTRMEVAQKARSEMLGLSQEEVLLCMGPPANRASTGSTSIWSYPSGGDVRMSTSIVNPDGLYPVAVTNANSLGCVVNVMFSSGAVSEISYIGRTGGLITEGEQCAFAVANCVDG